VQPAFNEQLLDAIAAEDGATALRLLQIGADPEYLSKFKQTPLEIAIDNNSLEMAELLLQNGSDLNSLKGNALPLIVAIDAAVKTTKNNEDVEEDSTDLIVLLIKYGADILKKGFPDGRTPYDFAKGSVDGYHLPAQRMFEQILNNRSAQ
jgi:ankyrin repeat protein